MADITLRGSPFRTSGALPVVGSQALDLVLVDGKLGDKRLEFAKDYGVLIDNGPLAGVTARAVVVLDVNDTEVHRELVSEITNEPNYDAAPKGLG